MAVDRILLKVIPRGRDLYIFIQITPYKAEATERKGLSVTSAT